MLAVGGATDVAAGWRIHATVWFWEGVTCPPMFPPLLQGGTKFKNHKASAGEPWVEGGGWWVGGRT